MRSLLLILSLAWLGLWLLSAPPLTAQSIPRAAGFPDTPPLLNPSPHSYSGRYVRRTAGGGSAEEGTFYLMVLPLYRPELYASLFADAVRLGEASTAAFQGEFIVYDKSGFLKRRQASVNSQGSALPAAPDAEKVPFLIRANGDLVGGALLADGSQLSFRATMPRGDDVFTSATVRFKTFEGGFFALDDDDGQAYDPGDTLPAYFRQDGLRVRVIARPRPDLLSFHQYGRIVDVIEIQRLP